MKAFKNIIGFMAIIIMIVLSGCAITQWQKKDKILATSFVCGQVVNYSQTNHNLTEDGWKESTFYINDIYNEFGMIGVFAWKAGTTYLVLKAADKFPKYRKRILIFSNVYVWTYIFHDTAKGAGFSFKF